MLGTAGHFDRHAASCFRPQSPLKPRRNLTEAIAASSQSRCTARRQRGLPVLWFLARPRLVSRAIGKSEVSIDAARHGLPFPEEFFNFAPRGNGPGGVKAAGCCRASCRGRVAAACGDGGENSTGMDSPGPELFNGTEYWQIGRRIRAGQPAPHAGYRRVL